MASLANTGMEIGNVVNGIVTWSEERRFWTTELTFCGAVRPRRQPYHRGRLSVDNSDGLGYELDSLQRGPSSFAGVEPVDKVFWYYSNEKDR